MEKEIYNWWNDVMRFNWVRERGYSLAVNAAVLFFACAFLYWLKTAHWSDSEIWGVRQAYFCRLDYTAFVCDWKPLFNKWMAWIGDDSVIITMNRARILMTVFWIFTFGVLCLYKISPLLALVYFSSSVFLIDAAVARSDFFALPFLLICAGELLRRKASRSDLFIACATIAILVTPKSIIVILCLIPLIKGSLKLDARTAALSLASVCLIFFFVDWIRVGEYFFHLFNTQEFGFPYWSASRFTFLIRALKENPQLLLAIGLLVWQLFRTQLSQVTFSALLFFGATIFYPDKLPFWLSCQTLMILFILSNEWKSRPPPKFLQLSVALISLAAGLYWLEKAKPFRNFAQVNLAESLNEKMLAQKMSVFDSLGLAYGSSAPSIYIGPGQMEENLKGIGRIAQKDFDVLILVHKLQILRTALREYLEKNYIEASPDVFVKARDYVVQHPQTPALEILEFVDRDFPEQREGPFAITILNNDERKWELVGQHALTRREIGNLSSLCSECKHRLIRVTPFGRFFEANNLPSYNRQFSFEPQDQQR